MKTFIFGANGMLGSYLYKHIKESVPIFRNQFEAMKIQEKNFHDQIELLGITQGSTIINAIGIINKRKKDPLEFMIVNAIFPRILADYCEKNEINLIHISTDCVFSGARGHYKENDLADDTSIYAISKSAGEPLNCTVIRASIIGENKNNCEDLLEWVRTHNNTVIPGWINHIWNGVTCLQLALICEWMIDNNYFWKGVRHIFSPSDVSKADLVEMINDIYGLNNRVLKTSSINDCDRTVASLYLQPFKIPELSIQIKEQKEFDL